MGIVELFDHQRSILDFHLDRPHSIDGSDVGVGKTAPAVLWLQRMFDDQKIRKALVLAPNSILDNWVAELGEWSRLTSVILRGSKDKRIALLQQNHIADVYILNYEGLRVIFPQLMAANFDCIIADELHHLKGHNTQQTKLALKLAQHASYRKGMTGTITTGDLLDVWSQAQFVDPRIFKTNFWGYRNRFMYDANAGKSWMKWPDWRPKDCAVDEIRKQLEPYMIRFGKREVLKFLPPVLFEKRFVEMSGEQERVYKQLKRDFVAEREGGEELAALQILPRITKLLEITSGFAYREGEETYRFEQNAKLTELKNVLEELGDKQAIIWTVFTEDAMLIEEALGNIEARFGTIIGATEPKFRQHYVDKFNMGCIQYLICHPACAGEGLTLLAPYAIYYSRGWKLGERIQSLGRNDRPGAEKYDNLTVIDLVCRNSIDEEVMTALEGKEDLLKAINPKRWKEMLSHGS